MITPVRVSYAVLAAAIILAGILHLGVPLAGSPVFVFCVAPTIFFHQKKMAGAGTFHYRCGGDWQRWGLFYPGCYFGVARCCGYLDSFGQRMGSEEANRFALQ